MVGLKGAARSTGPGDESTAGASNASAEERSEPRVVERAGAFSALLSKLLSKTPSLESAGAF